MGSTTHPQRCSPTLAPSSPLQAHWHPVTFSLQTCHHHQFFSKMGCGVETHFLLSSSPSKSKT